MGATAVVMGGSGSYREDLTTYEAPIEATWVLVVVPRSACALTVSTWAGGNRNGRGLAPMGSAAHSHNANM